MLMDLKMNKNPSENVKLIEELKPLVKNDEVDVVFCVPAISLIPALEAAKGTNIEIGAENMFYEESGAYRDAEGALVPSYTGICGDAVSVNVPAQSLTVITDMQ